MEEQLACDKCSQQAPVVLCATAPDQFAVTGGMLGLDRSVVPYLILACPKCGRRIIPEDATASPQQLLIQHCSASDNVG